MKSRLPLTYRVMFDGRARTIDRRPLQGAEIEKLPDHIWHTLGMVLPRPSRFPKFVVK